MGICASNSAGGGKDRDSGAPRSKERQRTKDIDSELNKLKYQEQLVNKLLLLGAGGCGKSTLFKQMIKIFGTGFQEAELRQYTNVIFNNIMQSVQTLIRQSVNYRAVNEENEDAVRVLSNLKEDQVLREVHGDLIEQMWRDPGIQATYKNRNCFNLNDSTEYFFQNIRRITTPGYVPSDDDVLRSRVPTTGIVENEFVIHGSRFRIFDVGGQRSERKKWIHCFENVTAVLFVAALSEFDQVLYEDEKTNRMKESLLLFDEVSNSHWFQDTSMMLFLNKRDLFAEKIQAGIRFSDYWPDYRHRNEYEPLVEHIKQLFLRQNNTGSTIYVHVTCATDSDNVAFVFEAVKDIVIKSGLAYAGLA